jgi:O-antigen/teichoic acid export membrane protein
METLNNFMGRVDIILIGLFVSPEIVGVYGAAFELAGMISKIRAAVEPTLPSLMQKIHHEKDLHKVEDWFSKCMYWTLFATLLIFGFILNNGDFFMYFLNLKAYEQFFILAPLVAFGRLLHAVLGLIDAPLYMVGHPKMAMSISLVNFFLNVIFFGILIPKIGIFGAGVGFLSSALFTSYYRLYLAKRILDIQPIRKAFVLPFVCFAIACGVRFLVQRQLSFSYFANSVIAMISFAAAYGLVFYSLRSDKTHRSENAAAA